MMYTVQKAQGIDIFHEVLFALSGTRSVFTTYPFAVKELFHLSESVLLERILNLGENYGKLRDFIETTKNKQFEEKNRVGLYLLAFAEYLNSALSPYWNDVVLLEQEIMNQSHTSLHFVWSRMHRHSELLSGLLSLVNCILSQNSYGCVVLQHLHQVLASDVGVIRAAVAVIIDGMNEVFFRQISCWLLYGDLVDSHQEFFIKQNNEETKEDTPFDKYSLNYAMLPNHIEISIAEKILRVGHTVLFLRSNPSYLITREDLDERSEICIDRNGLFGEKEKMVQAKLTELREICKWNDNGKMEKLVSEMSSYVTTQLWTLAMQDAHLLEQLHLVNDFFLLGRGELFHEFVTEIDLHLCKSSTAYTDFNLLLHESARKVLIKEESLQNFSLEIITPNADSDADDSEGEWNGLLVRYDAPWPLQLLFTKKALKAYNMIFRFLLRLKKIEVKLGQCWLFEKSKRCGPDNLKRRQLHRNLCFLVNNLQYYVHVDVLNSQFMILETAIKSSKDFERIQKAHDLFLENLSSQLFFCVDSRENQTKNPIKRSIIKILELCEEYYRDMDSQIDFEMSDEKINCMLTRFEAFVEFLLNHLTRITNQAMHPSSQHLLQFLLRKPSKHNWVTNAKLLLKSLLANQEDIDPTKWKKAVIVEISHKYWMQMSDSDNHRISKSSYSILYKDLILTPPDYYLRLPLGLSILSPFSQMRVSGAEQVKLSANSINYRWGQTNLCECCNMRVPESLAHFLLEYPAYSLIRDHFLADYALQNESLLGNIKNILKNPKI